MGLVESLEQQQKSRFCRLGEIINKLESDEKTALLNALESGMPRRDINFALRQNGYTIGTETVGAHKNKKCRCYL